MTIFANNITWAFVTLSELLLTRDIYIVYSMVSVYSNDNMYTYDNCP